jgi:hypothetical protein
MKSTGVNCISSCSFPKPRLEPFHAIRIQASECTHDWLSVHKIAVAFSVYKSFYSVHACNPSTQEAEEGGSQVPGQAALHKKTLCKRKEKRERGKKMEIF